MKTTNRLSIGQLLSVVLIGVLMLGASSCKNKKKVSEVTDPAAAKAQIEQDLEDEEMDEVTEPVRIATKAPSKTEKLENYFIAIATGTDASANANINEAIGLFSNQAATVLIIIYNADGTTDYDEPTTIRKYLEYLKDTKNNSAKVEEMVLDEKGMIKELVLKK
ncbi:MAG: pectin methylesterase-like acyl-CoA thioesterase [Marinoscillum sp.]|jgi:pectin methylesterase-like acyl-CoA thioesterase